MRQLVTHKAFPLVVALWFAALIGIGSLLVPTALVERSVVAMGLPSLISAAAPPLGMTAKILLGLAFGGLGAVLGLLLGRQLYRSGRGKEYAVAPINAHEELGENGLDGGFDEPLEDELVHEDRPEPEDAAVQTDAEDEVWELARLDEDAPGDDEPVAQETVDDALETEEPLKTTPQPQTPAFIADTLPENAPTPSGKLDDLSLIELAQRLQSAIKERRALHAAAPTAAVTAPAPETAQEDTRIDEPEATQPAEQAPQPESDPDPAPEASAVHHPAQKPFVETGDIVEDDGDGEVNADDIGETYSSLLAMTASVRAQPEEQARDEEAAPAPTGEAAPARSESESEAAPERTLAALDRAGERETPARDVDPQEQALRDALLNLTQFTRS